MRNCHVYTEEEDNFLKEYTPGHTYKEIQKAFTDRFGWQIEVYQIRGKIHRLGVKTGFTGQFEKGNIPYNKGVKGIYSSGSEKGWFKKGNVNLNRKPIGSERLNVDGYYEVKVAEPNIWKLKHRVIWEEHNGKIPKDGVVIFRDNNPLNCTIDNLILITKTQNLFLNKNGMCNFTNELKDSAVLLAKLNTQTIKRMKGERS